MEMERQSWPDKASITVKQCCSTSEKKFHFLDKPWNPLFSELIFIYIIPRKFFSAGVHFISSNLFLLLCILSPPIFGLFSLLSLVFSSLLIKQTREDREEDFAKLSNTRVPWQSKMKENLFQPKNPWRSFPSLESAAKPGNKRHRAGTSFSFHTISSRGERGFSWHIQQLAGQEPEPGCSSGKNQPLERVTGRAVPKRERQEMDDLLFYVLLPPSGRAVPTLPHSGCRAQGCTSVLEASGWKEKEGGRMTYE